MFAGVLTLACGGGSGSPGTGTAVLTVVRAGTGSGTVSGSGIDCGSTCTSTLSTGTAVSLTAVADSGSSFAGWSGCDSASGTTCTLTLDSNRTVTATFDLGSQNHSLTVAKTGSGSGTISGNGIDCGSSCSVQLPAGTAVSLTATAAAGSTLGSWTGCDSSSGTTCTLTLTSDRIVSAKFDQAAVTGQWVLGYYVGYAINSYPIDQIDWTALTHIAFAPLTVNADRSLNLTFADQNGTGPQDAMALSQAAHAHSVTALLMLGGAGAGSNIAAAADAAHRATFVASLLGALDTLGYDGLDLDWEDSVNLDDLVALAQALRAARPGIVLTYPAGALNANFDTVDSRMVTLAASLDRFNVQTYYPSTAFAGSGWDSWFSSPISGETASTPIAIDDTLGRYATAGIPKSKLGLGLAFYAICYTGGITGPGQATNGTTQVIVGGDNNYPLSAFFAAGSTFDSATAQQLERDSTAQVPYLSFASAVTDPGCGAPTQYIPYEDETSILAKGAFSKTNGYGGIIVWALHEGWLPQNASGGRSQNALMQALRTGFLVP
jgi:chitinase